MKHYLRIQKAVDFIEQHLHDPFTLQDVSKAAFSALSYMHRVFYQMTGYTMKEYIRKRRLAKSAEALHRSQVSILEIALSAGFESAESFSRAFKKNFGITPSDCRNKHPEISLCQALDITGQYQLITPPDLDFELNLEAVSYQGSDVIGFLTHTTLDDNQQIIDICHFANHIIQEGVMAAHFDLSTTPIFGLYTHMTDDNDFDYTIAGLQSACLTRSNRMIEHHIDSGLYAKFTLNRNDRIKEAWHYIYGYWFPQIAALRSVGFDFEIYHPDSTAIYIPMSEVPSGI